jgi:putative glutamine amidotransferase
VSPSYRPLIAVVGYHLASGRVSRWPEGGYGVPGAYIDALRRANARILTVNPGETNDAAEILEPFDGLLLVGGGDVDPARYGAEPDLEHNYGVETDRDELEIALIHEADQIGMPTLAICRGMQIMNVAFGGTLHQHLPDMPGLLEHGVPIADTISTHEVTPAPWSRLSATTKSGPLTCSSHHHQGVERLGERIVATGHSSDGLIEAIELGANDPDGLDATWMVGVQWHPEDTADADPAQQSLFDALALLSRLRGSRAKPGEQRGRSREYEIVDADPSWRARFETEATRIREALGGVAIRVDHVGSTSVPGLAAKPIIDIQASVSSMVPRHAYVEPLSSLGYRWVLDPWSDEHEYFSRDEDGARAYQIHVCETAGAWERRHLAFRDWLTAHPDDAAEYAELKRRLATEHPQDIMAYVDRKTDFIRSVEARALSDT